MFNDIHNVVFAVYVFISLISIIVLFINYQDLSKKNKELEDRLERECKEKVEWYFKCQRVRKELDYYTSIPKLEQKH